MSSQDGVIEPGVAGGCSLAGSIQLASFKLYNRKFSVVKKAGLREQERVPEQCSYVGINIFQEDVWCYHNRQSKVSICAVPIFFYTHIYIDTGPDYFTSLLRMRG